MSTRIKALVVLTLGAGAYFLLRILPFGELVLYPFQLMATILHEFGHAAGALLTGGDVSQVQINANGSGVTTTLGGWRFVVIAGGYIGSAIFGNILIRAGLKYGDWSKYVLYGLLVILITISTLWSASIGNTIFVALFAIAIYIVSRASNEATAWFLAFVGILTVLHIIEDFNVGPSSDLAAFAQTIPLLPSAAWMVVWLGIVVGITWWNVRSLVKG